MAWKGGFPLTQQLRTARLPRVRGQAPGCGAAERNAPYPRPGCLSNGDHGSLAKKATRLRSPERAVHPWGSA